MNDQPTPDDEPLNATPEEQRMLRQLRGNPLMAAQFQTIADRYEHEIANGIDAHQAEEAMIESLQELGRSMMRQWAQNTRRDALGQASDLQKHPKKLQWHTTFGVIRVTQQVMRGGREVRCVTRSGSWRK